MITGENALAEIAWGLSAMRDSVFYWDRPARPAPCKDPTAERLLRKPLAQLHEATREVWTPSDHPLVGIIEKQIWWRSISLRGGSALHHPAVLHALMRAGIDPEMLRSKGVARTVFAAGTFFGRLQHVGRTSFAFAVRRLLDPALLREAQRTGRGAAYFWLAALDAVDVAPALSLRRRQFAQAYPELVSSIIPALQPDYIKSGSCPEHDQRLQHAALAQAVDCAAPVTPLVQALRDWPPWVEKALRGRLTARSRMARALYQGRQHPDEPIGDPIARLLKALGPAWRPRHGDEAIVGFLSLLVDRLGVDARSLSALCPAPGEGPSSLEAASGGVCRRRCVGNSPAAREARVRWAPGAMIASLVRSTTPSTRSRRMWWRR